MGPAPHSGPGASGAHLSKVIFRVPRTQHPPMTKVVGEDHAGRSASTVVPSRHDAPEGTRSPACGTVHSGRKRKVRHHGAAIRSSGAPDGLLSEASTAYPA